MHVKKLLHRLLLATIAFGAVTTACSLVVDNGTNQCSTDADCQALAAGSVCRSNVCVSAAAAAAAAGGDGSTSGACTPKTPVTQLDILNEPCTNATCIKYDDCENLGLCNDASLPPLSPPGDGGVSK